MMLRPPPTQSIAPTRLSTRSNAGPTIALVYVYTKIAMRDVADEMRQLDEQELRRNSYEIPNHSL